MQSNVIDHGYAVEKKVRILFVTTGTETGGAENMLLKLITNLDTNRFVARVVSLTTIGPVGRRMLERGITVEELNLTPSLLGLVRGIINLRRLMRSFNPHLVQTWMYHADLAGGLAAKTISNTKVVWGIRQSNLDKAGSKRTTRLVARVCALVSHFIPDKIICCSNASISVHTELGYDSSKMVFIPNGFDPEYIKPNAETRATFRQAYEIPDDCILIGNVSRFDPQKDIPGFLSAAALFLKQTNRARFVMAGKGMNANNEELCGLIHQGGLDRAILLMGEMEDVRDVLSALDILTLTSAYGEGFPNIVGEAMLAETFCVVTDVGDSGLIVGDQGYCVPPRSPAAVVQAWQRFIRLSEADKSAMTRKGRARLCRDYGMRQVAARFQRLYEDVIGEARCAG